MNRSEPILDDEYYHVYNRGNRRKAIFGDDTDYRSFLKRLQQSAAKFKVGVVVYTLMPNHFHFVLVQKHGGSIQRLMNSIETSAAKRFDLKYREVGHLFQGRYRYNRIDSDESLLIVARYIHLNPVIAGLVRQPEEWPYSDFADILHRAAKVECVLQQSSTPEEGRLIQGSPLPCSPGQYVDFVRKQDLDEGILQPGSNPEEGRLLHGIPREQ